MNIDQLFEINPRWCLSDKHQSGKTHFGKELLHNRPDWKTAVVVRDQAQKEDYRLRGVTLLSEAAAILPTATKFDCVWLDEVFSPDIVKWACEVGERVLITGTVWVDPHLPAGFAWGNLSAVRKVIGGEQ